MTVQPRFFADLSGGLEFFPNFDHIYAAIAAQGVNISTPDC